MNEVFPKLLLLFGLCMAGAGNARELAVPEDELVPVEVVSVVLIPGMDSPAVLLRDPDSGEMVPIFVGIPEAQAIDRALRGESTPRPLTHDLALNLLDAGEVSLQRLVIDELRDDTFFAALELRRAGSEALLRVDTRPSDGMALALRRELPILLSRRVLQEAAPRDAPPPGGGPVIST